ncbi:hypothetical protein E3N88_31779 [Mikania micrantha]|uniref:Uncharacterized protein n=1 Tax=Mikania micrantha TaxID=192012 RepID=A0A5N6M6M4_9ASTR|nr:hypothetical protein E3N88_31779 [Mikania micrantha]
MNQPVFYYAVELANRNPENDNQPQQVNFGIAYLASHERWEHDHRSGPIKKPPSCVATESKKKKSTLPTQELSCSGSKGLSQPKTAATPPPRPDKGQWPGAANRFRHPWCMSYVNTMNGRNEHNTTLNLLDKEQLLLPQLHI